MLSGNIVLTDPTQRIMTSHELSILPMHHTTRSCSKIISPSVLSNEPAPNHERSNSPPSTQASLDCEMASTTTPSTSNSTSISTSTSASEQSARSGDEEAQSYPTNPPSGYPLLAACMGQMPQMAMFRRFSAMNAQDLLYRQAEIVGMEKELHELQHRDANKTGRPREYTQNWELLRHSARDGNSEQWDLVKKLRMKLKEYSKHTLK